MSRVSRITSMTVAVICLVLVCLVLVVPLVGGYERYVVTGGSMHGAIPKGALIYDRLVPVNELRVGDIITYQPPGSARTVTHRIVSVSPGENGSRVFQTKGDANDAKDPWTFSLPHPKQAVYRFHIPFLGYLLAALTLPIARILLVALPSLVLGLSLLRDLWREADAEVRARRGPLGGDAWHGAD